MSTSEVTRSSSKRPHEEAREHESAAVTKANSKGKPKKTKTDSEGSDGSQGSVAKAKPKPSGATSRTTRGSGNAGEKKHTPERTTVSHTSGQVKKDERAKDSPGSSTQDSGLSSGLTKDAEKKDTSSQRAHSSTSHASETQEPRSLHKAKITPNDICYIGYGIYLGSWRAARTNFLKANNITHVLSLGKKPRESLAGINWKHLPIEDMPGAKIKTIHPSAFEFIDEGTSGTNKILVHCQMGFSRSPSVVISYLHAKKNYSSFQAFAWVAERRPRIWLLGEFRRQHEEEASEEGSNSVDFNLPGDKLEDYQEREEVNKAYLKKLHESFSGRAEDSRKDEHVVFWTEDAKESALSNAS